MVGSAAWQERLLPWCDWTSLLSHHIQNILLKSLKQMIWILPSTQEDLETQTIGKEKFEPVPAAGTHRLQHFCLQTDIPRAMRPGISETKVAPSCRYLNKQTHWVHRKKKHKWGEERGKERKRENDWETAREHRDSTCSATSGPDKDTSVLQYNNVRDTNFLCLVGRPNSAAS